MQVTVKDLTDDHVLRKQVHLVQGNDTIHMPANLSRGAAVV